MLLLTIKWHFFLVYKIKAKTALETHQSGNHFDLINPRKPLILSHFQTKNKNGVVSINPFLFGANVHNVSKPGRENKN